MSARASRRVSAFAAGLLFATGLGVSGMTRPSKVLAFLDVGGAWDPSLALVMAAALGLNVLLFPRILRRAAPRFGGRFHLPESGSVDARLVVGAAIFGVGWGLGGYCPGPAIATAGAGALPAVVFTAAMAAGMVAFRLLVPIRARALREAQRAEAPVEVGPVEVVPGPRSATSAVAASAGPL